MSSVSIRTEYLKDNGPFKLDSESSAFAIRYAFRLDCYYSITLVETVARISGGSTLASNNLSIGGNILE